MENLKAKYGTIYTLNIPVGDDNKMYTIHLKKMDRIVYSAAIKILERDELDATEFILNSLHVGGDNVKDIIADFDALRVAAKLVIEVIKSKEGSIKKN